MTSGDPKETTKKTEKTDASGCTALVTVIGFLLLSLFAPAIAVYGLVTGQSMSIPSKYGFDQGHWYSRAKEPSEYWFAEALWLFFTVLSIAIWGYVLWSFRRPDKKLAPPSAAVGRSEPPDQGGKNAG